MTRIKSNLLQVHVQTADYEIREEEVRGTTYWVVPVVMMVEGVHHGSRGPVLYTEEELAGCVSAWNGMPVTIGHPQNEDGKYVSANLPSNLDGIVGRIYNSRMDGKKLVAEAWIDINSLTELSEDAFEYIKEKKELDVSIGVTCEEVRESGTFNGEAYRGEATNLRPDHLALLPGVAGACSWADGCGIRTNSNTNMKTDKLTTAKLIDKETWLANILTVADASFSELMRSVQDQLNRLDNDAQVYYLEEIYDNYFVYCAVNRQSGDRSLFKRTYNVSTEGKAVFRGEPVKVRKEVTYPVMSSEQTIPGKLIRTNFVNKNKSTMNTNKKCTCTVDGLIQNEATHFTETDREWLAAMSQEQLDKLAPKEEAVTPVTNKKTAETPAKEKEESLVSKNADGSININGKSMEQYIKESLGKETDPTKFIDNFMPDGLKDQMKSGLKMYNERREALIKGIAANSKFKAEQLKTWKDEDLTALHDSVVGKEEPAVGNYALGGGTLEEGEEDESPNEIAAMMSFNSAPKEVKKEKETPKK